VTYSGTGVNSSERWTHERAPERLKQAPIFKGFRAHPNTTYTVNFEWN
jgi:hypothetical protein